ncbi:MAG: radical SAM protein [Candidatus Aminicenantes bacterium]|nr:radical SAM protein [Candidatus Aminicenantes bacterium]NIM80881.1 radical SAM protein [Candidatus Aminicenantes bacterium]NIN20265.1 radical SAM protein [Candidatus Aminicenantes bacterium]NIN44044.1 radical SAM protein [Candidatus Aminicenantes bacterium]NIN86854.1 radical SAM protein [Candidatus Aminicenantes bacterium]
MQEKPLIRSLSVELTPRCNQQCAYCYNAWREDNGLQIGEPNSESIEKLLCLVMDQVRLYSLTLTGGEPFLRTDIYRIIDLANQEGIGVNIISNGGLITRDTAEKLARQKVNYVQITLAGADAQTHDFLCGKGTFDKVKKALESLRIFGVTGGGSYLCTSHNFHQAGEVFELFVSLGVKQIAFNRFNPSGDPRRIVMSLLPTRSQVLQALTAANQKSGQYKLKVYNTMPIPPCVFDYQEFPNIKFSQCSAGIVDAQLAIGPDGNVRLCTLQKQAVGSLWNTPLDSIISSEAVKRFREQIPDFCKECPLASMCLGGCGASAEWVFGSPAELDPFVAQHVMPGFGERILKC